MAVLTAAVVLLGALTVFNLVLTAAIARRVRTAPAADAGHAHGKPTFPDLDEVKAGAAIRPFSATTTTGEEVSYEDRYGDTAVYAFFDTSCSTCAKELQPLVDMTRREGFTPHQVIAFVVHDDEHGKAEKREEYLATLGDTVTVVVHRRDGIDLPFDAGGYPAFVLVDGSGQVTRSGVEVSDLDTVLVPA